MNEVRLTGDGSTTLFSHTFSEHYHSVFGAITESKHVFIENGLQTVTKNPVSVFEIGFGTGLNAYLACLDAKQNKRTVTYYAIEKFPLENPVVESLNYPGLLATEESGKKIFNALHEAEWGKPVAVTSAFSLFKIRADLCLFHPIFNYDVIFFDAFAPDRQPEMWTTEIFRGLYNKLNPGGILTTYCVKGHVKRSMKEAGFRVEKLPGPPGKREMLRAVKVMEP
jgi:tRNA U34 5-methylaminomethyl-2-thiouridine-forming methyltransferase MnmC